MKGFRFRLARVLRVRRIEEQLARAVFVERLEDANHAEERSTESLERRREMQSQLTEQVQSGPIRPTSVIQAQDSIEGMAQVCSRRHERASTLALQAEQARAPWSETRIEVRALESLEEKNQVSFRAEHEKRANREMDETATRRSRSASGANQVRGNST